MEEPQIYNITSAYLNNKDIFQNYICENLENNYYWSDDWSVEFYKQLAYEGFITTTFDTPEGLVLLPELQYEYAILDFKNLHISKKVKKLINSNKYTLSFNTKFDELINKFKLHHKDNWIRENYIDILNKIYKQNDKEFLLLSVELTCNKTGDLIGGEVGYVIGTIYTSLSGFSSKDKEHNNCGNLQLVLLAKFLEKSNFSFWNLGHPHMDYKKKLGSTILSRDKFLKIWREYR
jgi:Leu/Phe-tRNA-protein transferase